MTLHAAPDGDGRVLLTIDLLSTADGDEDWQVNGTILLPLSRFEAYAQQVIRQFGPAA